MANQSQFRTFWSTSWNINYKIGWLVFPGCEYHRSCVRIVILHFVLVTLMFVVDSRDVHFFSSLPSNTVTAACELSVKDTVYPKKYAHGFCFAVLCCGYTLTDFPISIRLTSLALWQSNDCPSASKATLMNMDKYFMWIHYERLHNHNKAKHNKTVCIFLGIYCMGKTCTASQQDTNIEYT